MSNTKIGNYTLNIPHMRSQFEQIFLLPSAQGVFCRRIQQMVFEGFQANRVDFTLAPDTRNSQAAREGSLSAMLEISTRKVARVILLTREYGPESPHLFDYISGLNDDEKANLVALMWIGRDSFSAEELEYAKAEAKREASAPTENYLTGIPSLAEHLESGLEALGIDVTDVEDNL